MRAPEDRLTCVTCPPQPNVRRRIQYSRAIRKSGRGLRRTASPRFLPCRDF
jgi:hypothetical protein